MSKPLAIEYDSGALDAISSEFDLREPNRQALRKLVFALEDGYDPEVTQVLDLATGVGKTYLMAAFVEYLRQQGVGNVVIVTPGKTVQAKTVQNFTEGSRRYIAGAQVPPEVVTPQDYSAWVARINGPDTLSYGREVPMLAFIFNILQLIAPKSMEGATHGGGKQDANRRPRKFDESAGVLFDYLKGLDDLVVVADESHLYSESAEAFNAALRELDPAATVGLTASPLPGDHVIFRYPLYQAIADEYVKAPVLAFRKGGYGEDEASEEQQLADAKQLREIKQRYYDAYAEQEGLPHLNAVMFVVCSDTDHATQVTELLRSPRYFNSSIAVLQVDSNHDDAGTARLLEGLDDANSPVLAVVSVNKLKEGWDVKNIAVVVTLRAMASEVLTQQTMGRGLRLPFGHYTGLLQVDQLDIISHQSFRELLEAENVLVQFGLEDAVDEAGAARVAEEVRRVAGPVAGGDAGISEANGAPAARGGDGSPRLSSDDTATGADDTAAPGVGVRIVDDEDDSSSDEEQAVPAVVTVPRNPSFSDVTYDFPCTRVDLSEPTIALSYIEKPDIIDAARRVTSTGDVLVRKEIVKALGKSLKTVDTESAEVDSLPITEEDAATALVRLVLSGNLVPVTPENKAVAQRYLVKTFMANVTFDHWTVKSLASASEELGTLVKEFAKEALCKRIEETKVFARRLPGEDELRLKLGESVHDQIDTGAEFVRGRFYGGWFKSLFEAESFDSYTGEYLLAKLLNTSPHIRWWHRLHPEDRAFIFYNPKDRYFPDFVALDDHGTYWIIEGKDARGRENERVQAKRKAAEGTVHRLLGTPGFEDRSWGYLIAYEDDVKRSDSWDDLKAKAQPVSNE